MVSEGNSNIVVSTECTTLRQEYAEVLHFFNGKALVLTQKALALYKNTQSIHNELGNGLLSLCEIPVAHQLNPGETPWVTEYQSGVVRFQNNRVLLILPREIRFYENQRHALKNISPILTLENL